jgi:hypothetical protein
VKKYTQEEVDYLTSIVPGRTYKEIAELFNKQFNLNLTTSQVNSFVGNRKLNTGRTGSFEKGMKPWNKGLKGYMGRNKTTFKKGNKPHNWVPAGSERITRDGYIEIKIKEGRFKKNWRGKHIVIWEQHNGALPKGHVIIFGDRDNRNFDIKNLICVSRQQLLIMNNNSLIKKDAELTRTGVIIADLHKKIREKVK